MHYSHSVYTTLCTRFFSCMVPKTNQRIITAASIRTKMHSWNTIVSHWMQTQHRNSIICAFVVFKSWLLIVENGKVLRFSFPKICSLSNWIFRFWIAYSLWDNVIIESLSLSSFSIHNSSLVISFSAHYKCENHCKYQCWSEQTKWNDTEWIYWSKNKRQRLCLATINFLYITWMRDILLRFGIYARYVDCELKFW